MFGKGKHTSRELIRRLRSDNRYFERQMQLMQVRLRKTGELLRTETVQREIAEGLVLQRDDRIAVLERELSERTVEMPLPKTAEPDLAGVA